MAINPAVTAALTAAQKTVAPAVAAIAAGKGGEINPLLSSERQ